MNSSVGSLRRRASVCARAAVLWVAWSSVVEAAPRSGGHVTLTLEQWSALLERSESRPPPPAPPVASAILTRSLDGAFTKGLLRATLVLRFEVLSAGHVRVPVVGDAASVTAALVDRHPAALVREGGMYTVGVDRPGPHEVTASLLVGEEQDHFARRLKLQLPTGGSTLLSILVPEPEIEARLTSGVLTASTARAGGTLLQGALDASGRLDLAWTRKVTHRSASAARLEARANTLLTVDDAVVRGVSVLDLNVLDGETDRVDLRLPSGAEPLRVTGDAVLQWRAGKGQLSVLLRHLVRGSVQITVHYQLPGGLSSAVALPMILPAEGVPFVGAAAIQAPASLEVKVSSRAARELSLRDLPTELGELTRSPLAAAFSFRCEPHLTLTATKRQQVALTTTLIDELHAATVVVDEGTELTKLRLHIRNNTRQYLGVQLPTGATLTHALVDGQPIRPARAIGSRGAPEALLFPLRQSERVARGANRQHRVEAGETLGEIAHLYYSDPTKWALILDGNRNQLRSDRQLRPGMQLVIPSARQVTIEESSFVLELSYRRRGRALGLLGRQTVQLPELDVDVMKVYWHLYLPSAVTPLHFSANLTQLSGVRYDPLRRARDFLRRALDGQQAWAGGYRSMLTQRKRIFEAEARQRGEKEAAPATFPLVGERYRFTRILAARERPVITVLYAGRAPAGVARWGALLLAAGLTLLLVRNRRWWRWPLGAAGLSLLLVLGHAVPGSHRRMIWGVAAALAVDLWRRFALGHRVRALIWEPWTAARLATPRRCALTAGLAALCWIMTHYPLLLSTMLSLSLGAAWLWSTRARAPKEEADAGADAR
jgi:hypothetical protein